MQVLVRPPSESCSRRVSFDSLYGMCELRSTSALITRPRVSKVLGTTTLDVLASCKIDQVQLAGTEIFLAILGYALSIYHDGEHGMTSRTEVIALGSSNLALITSIAKHFDTVGGGSQMAFLHTLDQGCAMALLAVVLENLQLDRVICREQVAQLFVVEFDKRAFDGALGFGGFESVEQGV
jgi:hypothetical protein